MDLKFIRPALKYSEDALQPAISPQTVSLHYGKHLQAYLDNLNFLLDGSDYRGATLNEIVTSAKGALFNNAAQVWNHIFYFDTFSPTPQPDPRGSLREALEFYYGSVEEFKEDFQKQGASIFGSGWVWLSKDQNDRLRITSGQGAYNPMCDDLIPLLTFDVWEHAYYVDYKNRRADHLAQLWEIVDWAVVESRYAMIQAETFDIAKPREHARA